MNVVAYQTVMSDELKIKAFLKELLACAKHMGKKVDVPYKELVALVEHAKANPSEYLELKESLND